MSFLRKRCIAANKVAHANQSFPKFRLARLIVSLPVDSQLSRQRSCGIHKK